VNARAGAPRVNDAGQRDSLFVTQVYWRGIGGGLCAPLRASRERSPRGRHRAAVRTLQYDIPGQQLSERVNDLIEAAYNPAVSNHERFKTTSSARELGTRDTR